MWLFYVQLLGRQNRCWLVHAVISIRVNCQLMKKLEAKHILQAQLCDGISTKKTKRETSDTS